MSKLYFSLTLPFGALGFYRGTQNYGYNYRTDMKTYNEQFKKYNEQLEEYNKKVEDNIKSQYKYKYIPPNFYSEKPYYFYSWSILYGLFGTVMYVNPFTTPFMVMKEVYRLEINMRNELDELKDEAAYYKVFI